MWRVVRRSLALAPLGLTTPHRPTIVQARSLNCQQQAELDNAQLQKLLQKADQTSNPSERYRMLAQAVELGEKMELPIGHQGRLYDMAANAAYQTNENKKAEQYFLLAINRWVRSGVKPESPAIIDISLKLANLYKQDGAMDKAYSGFKWCVDTTQKYMKEHPDEDQHNLMALYGIALDSLGRFLYDAGQFNDALPIIQESIKVAETVDVDGEQIVTLKINFSSVLAEAGHNTEALDMLNEVLMTKDLAFETKINALLNKALLYKLKMEDDENATISMKEAIAVAMEAKDPQQLLEVKKLAQKFKIKIL